MRQQCVAHSKTMSTKTFKNISAAALLLSFAVSALAPLSASATKADDLRAQIADRTAAIQQLEKEIADYKAKADAATSDVKSLKQTVAGLDASIAELQKEISLTQDKISRTDLTIQSLTGQIGDTQGQIGAHQEAIGDTLRQLQEQETRSIIDAYLAYPTISGIWQQVDRLQQFQDAVRSHVDDLKLAEQGLETNRTDVETQKKSLIDEKATLASQQKAVQSVKQDKAKLLAQTKDQESQYQKIVAQKQAAKKQFENELFSFESQLQIEIDPTLYPSAHPGVLSWPIDNPFVTQLFGKTVAARTLYVSGSHSGVDFRASIGTPIKAALSGVVQGTGNTDLAPSCYSYGKWVLIRHDNGLSTIYGHLSAIGVSQGDAVTTGQVIGYSGMTGYATGPHLHFGVYASQGVRIQKYSTSIGCKNVDLPIAPHEGYLNPMDYLPQISTRLISS